MAVLKNSRLNIIPGARNFKENILNKDSIDSITPGKESLESDRYLLPKGIHRRSLIGAALFEGFNYLLSKVRSPESARAEEISATAFIQNLEANRNLAEEEKNVILQE